MSRLGINTGNSPNDGQGDPLKVAMGKINSNFTEIYGVIGDGNNLISYASTAGISTLAQNLTGSPKINVSGILNTGITTTEHIEVVNITSTGVVTATQFVGDGSQLSNVTALVGGLEVLDDNVRKGVARELNFGANIVSTGPDGVGRVTISVSTVTSASNSNYASVAGVATYASTAGISTVSQGLTGTPNLDVGVVTATSFVGDGSALTGIITTLVAGANITITQTSGIATISAAGTGGGGSGDFATIAGYSTSSGISTVSQGLTGIPNIIVGIVTATRIETTVAGTPTIDSPNNLNINAVTVAISTDVTVGRDFYAGINTSTGLILRSPNGSKYRLVVDNSGNLSTVLVP